MSKKGFAALALTVVLCIACAGVLFVSADATPTEYECFNKEDPGGETAYFVKKIDTIGIHFKPNGDFTSVSIHTPTWGESTGGLTVSVYAWKGTYDGSLDAEAGPVAVAKMENLVDGAWTKFDFGQTVPAGEYLLYVENSGTNPYVNVGVYAYNNAYSGGGVYYQGILQAGKAPSLKVTFTDTNAAPFAAVSDATTEVVPFFPDGSDSPQGIGGNDVYAIQFAPTKAFSRVALTAPNYANNLGNLTFTIYQWDTNYSKSIHGKALASYEFQDYPDANVGLTMRFASLPAGEYVLTVTNTSANADEAVGLWFIPGTYANTRVYLNGSVVEQAPRLSVMYDEPAGETKYGSLSENVAGPASVPFYQGSDNIPQAILKSDAYAIQFAPTQPFYQVTIGAPSYNNDLGNLKFVLYKWNRNYETTIKGDPICEKEFVNYPDVNPGLTMNFLSQPAGEYLLVVTNTTVDPDEQVGLWCVSSGFASARNYLNGKVVANQAAHLTVGYDITTNTPYGTLSDPVTEENPGSGDIFFLLPCVAALLLLASVVMMTSKRRAVR